MPGINEAARQVMDAFRRMQEAIDARYAKQLSPHKLTVTQFKVLQHLSWHPEGLSIGEISGHLGLTSSTISGLIDRLQRDGWVERKRDSRDRRRVTVVLTEKSSELFKEKPRTAIGFWQTTMQQLSEDERDQLLASLTNLQRVMEKPDWPPHDDVRQLSEEMLAESLQEMLNLEASRVGMLLLIARQADENNRGEIAAYLKQMSYEELNHAFRIAKCIGGMKTLAESLQLFLEEECRSHTTKMDASQLAEDIGHGDIADVLREIADDEKKHRQWLRRLLEKVQQSDLTRSTAVERE